MDVYDFSDTGERPAQAANISTVMHTAKSTPISSRPTPRSKSTPRVKAAAVPTPKTAPPKIRIKDILLPSGMNNSRAENKRKRATPAKRAVKKAKSKPRQRYVVEAIVGVRRANDWADNSHTYQYAVKWTGYEQVTWNAPEILDNYPLVLRLVTDALEQSSDGKLPVYAPQPPDEEEGVEFTGV